MLDLAIRRGLPVVALLLAGCSSLVWKDPPPPDPNLYPSQYKTKVADFIRTYLENPTKVRDAAISEPQLKEVAGSTRYVSCVRYTPRNARNQYEATEERIAIFYAGGLNQFLPIDRALCANAFYQRFPEAEVLVP